MIYRRLWMFLLILAGTLLVDAQETLSIDNFRIARGETKEIAINLNNTSSVRALQVQIILPDGVKMSARPQIVQSRNGSYIDEFGEVVEAVKTLSYNQWNDGSYMVTVNADDGIPFAGTEGAVIMLTLQAEETAPLGQSLISLKNMELVYEDGQTFVSPPDVTSQVDIYQIVNLTVLSGGNGTVTGGGAYEVGDTVTLTATPILGFQFVQWSDGSNENPYTFIASENKTLTASFETVPYYVIYMVDGVEYKRIQMLYGDAIVLENEPAREGYTFSGWSKTPSTMPAENVIVSGTFTVNNYNLVYILDGVEYKRESIAYGTTILAESIPSKIGHSFTGWNGLPATMPAKDVMVTGRFVANSYEISFSLDGTIIKTAYVTYGAAITPPEVPTKEGYSFSGWVNLPSTMPAEDIVINGSFMVNSYVITYMVDGVEYYTESIAYGSTVEAIAAPAKEGYAFSGWSEIPATMPASDITISGSFAVNSYTVTYMVDGELYKTESYAYGSSITAVESPVKEGHTFGGWSENPATMPAGNITITGSFTVNSYTITYMVDGEVYKTESIAYGSMVEAIAAPIKEGYTFGGWSGVPSTMPAKDITINGSFTVNSYTVTYMVDGDLYKTENYAYGSYITAADFPVKEGHTFGGWSEIPATMPAGNITITGSFTVNSYTITYMVDGEVYKTESIAYGSMVEAIAAPIKEGYTFGGWSGVPSTMPAKDITINGSFTVNSYTVTYMVDGELYKTESYAYGAAITVADAPTKEGYAFSGWSGIPSTMPAKDIMVSGSFMVNSYTVTYMVDGKLYKTESYAYGAAITAAEAPTKEGYAFSGWSGVPSTMPAKDITISGSFTVNSYTVTYMVDGELYKTESYAYGAAITAAEAPSKEGHTFCGWSEAPETMPAENVTINGSFSVNSYTITFVLESKVFAKYTLHYGSAIEVPEAPQKEGLTFSGWGKIPDTMPAQDLVFEGSYMNNPYTIIYIVDGVEYHRASVEYGSVITLIPAPVKEGHTFSGWSEVPETMPAGDITVSGSFTVNSYIIIYYVDGEEFYKESIPFGASVSTIEAPQKEGYTFSGWSEIPATMPAKDVTVNGAFSINTYIATFMVDGEEYCRVNVVYGEEIILVDTPTKEGHTFSGWGEVPTTMPAKDITINGSFSINSYIVTYVVDGEVYKTESITYGSKLTPIAVPVKEGHTFSGWGGAPNTMPAKDVTINGTFTINTYTITYMVDGEVYQTMIVTYGEAITLIDNPSKEGYTFSGWLDAPERMPAKDVTINGRFVTNGYTVTYLLDGEVYKTFQVEYGSKIPVVEEPAKEGYTFGGWSEVPSTMPAKDVTISGTFIVNTYTVTYMVDSEVYQTVIVAYGDSITLLDAPIKEGYTFSGWMDAPSAMPAHDVTIHGRFVTNAYTVTYMVDGEVYKTFQVEYGAKIPTVEAPSKEGHTFSGWSGVPATMPAKGVTISGTLTINKYLVTFKIDDEVIAADSLEYGATIVAPEAPEKEGYSFEGWRKLIETVPANDVTIEGSYSVNSYLLTFTVDGETVQTDSVAYGTAISLLDEPTMEGYTFSGWSEVPETMPASDVTISGAFTINKYLVTFKVGDEVIAADSLEYGATIVVPEAPDREGYTFDGWGGVAETVPASDVTYEGTYTVNIYKVYYYVGEELVHTAEVAYGETIPEYVYEPIEESYTFLGWIGDNYETMPAHDVTYTANIDDAIRQLTIDNSQLTIYDLSGRKIEVDDLRELEQGIYIVNGHKVVIEE